MRKNTVLKWLFIINLLSFIFIGCSSANHSATSMGTTSEDILEKSAIENEIKLNILSNDYHPDDVEMVLLLSSDDEISCSIHLSWPESTSQFLTECYYIIPSIKEILNSYKYECDTIGISSKHADDIISLTYISDDNISLIAPTGFAQYSYDQLNILLATDNSVSTELSTPTPLITPEPTPTPIATDVNENADVMNSSSVDAANVPSDQESMPSATSSDANTANNGYASTTTEQKNALGQARKYLKISAFSYEGLIGQLEFEGYSHDAAVYAVDNCGADWNEQALNKAKSHLSISAFSHQGLIEQLEYEEFTSEQAMYGADNCGADWNEQAAKKAASHLSISAFSRDDLISQLKYEGFTDEQANYGVQSNGY